MKVLHVLNELRPSGAEIMLRIAAPLFRANGVDCELLATGATPGPYASVLEASGYRIHHIPFSKSPVFFIEVARLVKHSGFDLVHLHAERGFFAYVLAMRLAGCKKLVRTVHSHFNFRGFLRFRRGVERRLAERLGVHFVAIAPGVEQTERSLYGTSPRLIPNWFDSARFHPATLEQRTQARTALGIAADEFVIVTVGNCAPVKNHGALIAALAQCKELSWRYLHVGLEEAGSPERILVQQFGLSGRVDFVGPVDDIRPYLHVANLYVMPSLREGMSIAALEALASGLKVLLTDVMGLVDFRHYLEGIDYCQPSPEGLAAALHKLLSQEADSELVEIERSAVIHRIFGSDRGVEAYSQLYAEILGKSAHKPLSGHEVPEQGN